MLSLKFIKERDTRSEYESRKKPEMGNVARMKVKFPSDYTTHRKSS